MMQDNATPTLFPRSEHALHRDSLLPGGVVLAVLSVLALLWAVWLVGFPVLVYLDSPAAIVTEQQAVRVVLAETAVPQVQVGQAALFVPQAADDPAGAPVPLVVVQVDPYVGEAWLAPDASASLPPSFTPGTVGTARIAVAANTPLSLLLQAARSQ